MRGGVGADEKAAIARCRGAAQGHPVKFPLGHRETVEMRPQTTLEYRGPVDHEMMRRDGPGDAWRMRPDDLDGLFRGDVLDDDLQALILSAGRATGVLHEDALAVEDIDRGIGGFAVNQDRHADPFHPFQYRANRLDIANAEMGVRRGTGRIELGRDPDSVAVALLDLIGGGLVCQVTVIIGRKSLPAGRAARMRARYAAAAARSSPAAPDLALRFRGRIVQR